MGQGARRWLLAVLVLTMSTLAPGCTRQDNDALARIGRKLADRAEACFDEFKEGLHLDPSGGDSLENRVTHRIRWDKTLTDVAIEVKAKGAEIELTGMIADPMLKQRIVDLAESTAGVEKVIDHLQVMDLNPAPVLAPVPGP
jgi:hypothetical protein